MQLIGKFGGMNHAYQRGKVNPTVLGHNFNEAEVKVRFSDVPSCKVFSVSIVINMAYI